MTRAYSFFVPGQPKPKERARVANGHAYTPESTRLWESLVGSYALAEVRGDLLQGDVQITLTFRRKGQHRADLDNLCKAVCDSCNGVLFKDDQQITRLIAQVEYGCIEPGVSIEAEEREA